MKTADDYVNRVLVAERDSTTPTSSERALFLQLLLSPLRKQSDGTLWPYNGDKATGLLWIMDAIADNVEEAMFKDYVSWCFITDLRYQFENGDDVAGMEIHQICTGLGLYVPDDVQAWMNEKMLNGQLITKSQSRKRKSSKRIRAIAVAIDTLITLFPGLTVPVAIGAIIARYEKYGEKVSEHSINDYLYRSGKKRAEVSKSWMLSNSKSGGELQPSELAVWRNIILKRYDETYREILKRLI